MYLRAIDEIPGPWFEYIQATLEIESQVLECRLCCLDDTEEVG
jgi:hypothetical protein